MASDLSEKTVLLVEDDPDISRLVGYALEAAGYTVRTVGNGHSALRLVAEDVPDVMVLDLMLPGMHGREVVRACREHPETADLPIVVMSAAYDALDDSELSTLVVVAKPFDVEMLVMLVDDAVASARRR